MIKLINGWTKETVMAQVKKYNNGTKAVVGDSRDESCVYRSKSGNRCFIGCFIPDGHPGLNVIGSAETLLREYKNLKMCMPFASPDLLIFQSVHDDGPMENTHLNLAEFLEKEVLEPKGV